MEDVVAIPPSPTSLTTTSPSITLLQTCVNPLVSTLLVSQDQSVHYRFIADIYSIIEEVTTVDKENVVMIALSEEPTCYRESSIKAYWYEAMKTDDGYSTLCDLW